MSPYVVAFIFARGGSRGVPHKNVRLLAGKPLLAHAIEAAFASELIDRVIVSTDDAEIAEIAQKYGAEVPFLRPKELARDDSPEWFAWQHAVQALQASERRQKIDVFVCVPATSPLRRTSDVDSCIQTLLDSNADIVIAVKPADRNPYYNMVVFDREGYARLVIPPVQPIYHRQAAPSVFDMTTIAYAARPDFVLGASSMFEGRVKAIVVPRERAIDIETELDFKFAEFLLNQSRGA